MEWCGYGMDNIVDRLNNRFGVIGWRRSFGLIKTGHDNYFLNYRNNCWAADNQTMMMGMILMWENGLLSIVWPFIWAGERTATEQLLTTREDGQSPSTGFIETCRLNNDGFSNSTRSWATSKGCPVNSNLPIPLFWLASRRGQSFQWHTLVFIVAPVGSCRGTREHHQYY